MTHGFCCTGCKEYKYCTLEQTGLVVFEMCQNMKHFQNDTFFTVTQGPQDLQNCECYIWIPWEISINMHIAVFNKIVQLSWDMVKSFLKRPN